MFQSSSSSSSGQLTSKYKDKDEVSDSKQPEVINRIMKSSKIKNSFIKKSADIEPDPTRHTEIPPEEMVLGIDMLHTMILEAMTDEDLLHNARLVDFRWNSVATKILQKRHMGSIRFDFVIMKRMFFCRKLITEYEDGADSICQTNNTLECLTTLMSNSLTEDFPVTSFIFNYGVLDSPHFQRFFNLHGTHVHHLSMRPFNSMDDETPTLALFTKLLTEQAPNLSQLRLENYPEEWHGTWDEEKNVFVEKLKLFPSNENNSLRLKDLDLKRTVMPSEQLIELVKASPNLTNLVLSLVDLPLVNYLIQSGRLSLLQRFLCFYCYEDNVHVYEKLAKEKLKLKSIEVNLRLTYFEEESPFWPRIARCLEKILHSSSESLESLTWFDAGNLPYFSIPVFKNVKDLTFTDYVWGDNQTESEEFILPSTVSLFPSRAPKLPSIFPNLVHVYFHHFRKFEEHLVMAETCSEPLLKVHAIRISRMNNYSPDLIAKLALLFPNVTKGRFEGIGNFSKVAESIWKFSKLKHLRLEINAFSQNNQFPTLDEGFTGLSYNDWMCDMEKDSDGRLLKVKSSIADLKALVSLRLTLADDLHCNHLKDGSSLITEYSVDHAFRHLPNLVVYMDISAGGVLKHYTKIKKSLSKMEQSGCDQIVCEWNA